VFFGFLNVGRAKDYIGAESFVAQADTAISENVFLAQGSQFTRPANVDGYWTLRSFFTAGLPFRPMKSNLNVNWGYRFSRTPGIINGATNVSRVHNVDGGFVLGSNISPEIDFAISYAANFSAISNTVYPELDADYLYHRASARLNWLPRRWAVVDTNVNLTRYQGLTDDFNESKVLWNAGVGYKFLKGNGGEIKLVVADILNKNNNVTRTVNEFYVEDNETNVLGRYLLLNLTYTLRNYRM
jgi:hypothetical protein